MITYPRADILSLCGVSDTTFWPMHRQELSRTAGAGQQAKDLGSPLWRASFTTAPALVYDNAALEAALISLNGSARSFLAHDMRRRFPKAHRDGDFADTAEIDALYSANAFKLRLAGLPGGFTLSPGDYLGFEYGLRPSRALHMVTDGAVVSGGSAVVEVFPAIRPGAAVGAPVTLKRAPCEMILLPGQSAPQLRGILAVSLSFSAVQVV